MNNLNPRLIPEEAFQSLLTTDPIYAAAATVAVDMGFWKISPNSGCTENTRNKEKQLSKHQHRCSEFCFPRLYKKQSQGNIRGTDTACSTCCSVCQWIRLD